MKKIKSLLLFALEIAVVAAILYFIKGKLMLSHHHEINHYMPMLIDISFLALFASFGGRLAKAINIAPMAGKIIMGIIAGPALLGVLDPYAEGVEFARLAGVLFILFEAGLHFDMNLLKKNIGIATLVAEDKKLWQEAIKNTLPVMDYYIKRVLAGVDLNRSDHKKIAVNKLLPIIKFLKSNIEQTHYLQILADKLNLPLEVLQQDFESAKSFLEVEQPAQSTTPKISKDASSLGEQILSLAFYKDNYLEKVVADIEPESFVEPLQSLYKKVIIYYTKHQFLKDFLDQGDLENTEKELWIKLSLMAEKDYEEFTEQELANHFQTLLANFKKQHLTVQRQDLIQQLKQAELANDESKQDEIMHQINLLNKGIHKL